MKDVFLLVLLLPPPPAGAISSETPSAKVRETKERRVTRQHFLNAISAGRSVAAAMVQSRDTDLSMAMRAREECELRNKITSMELLLCTYYVHPPTPKPLGEIEIFLDTHT